MSVIHPVPPGYEELKPGIVESLFKEHPDYSRNYIEDLVGEATWSKLFPIPDTHFYAVPQAWIGAPEERSVSIVHLHNLENINDYGFTVKSDFIADVIILKKIDAMKPAACLMKAVHHYKDSKQDCLDHGIFLFA